MPDLGHVGRADGDQGGYPDLAEPADRRRMQLADRYCVKCRLRGQRLAVHLGGEGEQLRVEFAGFPVRSISAAVTASRSSSAMSPNSDWCSSLNSSDHG